MPTSGSICKDRSSIDRKQKAFSWKAFFRKNKNRFYYFLALMIYISVGIISLCICHKLLGGAFVLISVNGMWFQDICDIGIYIG